MRALKTGFGILAAAALLYAMRVTTPNYDGRVAPIVEHGRLGGGYIEGRRFSARVDAVETARRLRFARAPSTIEERDTSGIWVVVRAQAMAAYEPTFIGSAELLTRDGRRYQQTARVPTVAPLFAGRELQPAVAEHGVFVFELPADALVGASLVLAANRIAPLDSALRFDLALTAAPAAREFVDLPRP